MIKKYLEEHIDVYKKLDISSFENGLELIRKTFLNKGKIITCGNGGSALTASHYITDWNKAITLETGVPFQGISLADNIGTITALANDLSYCDIFSEQLKALINRKDLLIAISGSGNSINVINAVEYANSVGACTLAVVGYDGGELIKRVQNSIWIPSFDMQICEDIQLMFGHMVVKALAKNRVTLEKEESGARNP